MYVCVCALAVRYFLDGADGAFTCLFILLYVSYASEIIMDLVILVHSLVSIDRLLCMFVCTYVFI